MFMYRRTKFVVIILLITYSLSARVYFGEAEDNEFKSMSIQTDSTASGGKYLKMLDSGFVKWNVIVEQSGWYELSLGYRAFGGDKEEFLVVNNKKWAVGLGYADEWKKFTKKIALNKGGNSIELLPSWGHLDIDFLSVDTTIVFPTLKSLRNNYYKNIPRDLSFKINRYGYTINSVYSGDLNLSFSVKDFPYEEDAVTILIPSTELSKLGNGNNILTFEFDNSYSIGSSLFIDDSPKDYDLKIITPYVEHGSAAIIIFPNGKTMLIDCGKDWVRDSILIPLLHKNNINRLDYFILTHYHDDHASGDKGEKIKGMFNVQKFYDYKSFTTGESVNFEGVDFKILNSFNDGKDENTSSLALKITYNNFVLIHGGDTYGINQQRIMKQFPGDTTADVFYANHHFHGSIDVDYIRAMNPAIVLLQAQEAIYARDAYSNKYKVGVEKYLFEYSNKYIEDLPTLEVGTVVLRVNSKEDWTYETYPGLINHIPNLAGNVQQ
jgi:beta-lactamase superfamily II metal-dependent hydrolase